MIEKLLEAYAETRRRSMPPDFRMDGPTRNLLLAEVRRLNLAKVSRKPAASWLWATSWSRIGIALAAVALLLSLSYLLSTRPGAKQTASLPHPETRLLPGDAPSGVSSSAFAEAALAWDASPTPGSDSNQTNSVSDGSVFAQPRSFTRVSLAAPAQTNASILHSFTIQRAGQQMRVIDQDGSIYTGALVAAAGSPSPKKSWSAAKTETGSRIALVDPPVSAVSGGAWAFSLQATGTNRSLNQSIIITARLSFPAPATNSAPIHPAATDPKLTATNVLAPARPSPNRTIRLEGSIWIGVSNTLPIQAVSEAR